MIVTWEYKTLPDLFSPCNPVDRLNKEGSQGWELVCATTDYFVFKRPKLAPDSQPEQEEAVLNPVQENLACVATYEGQPIQIFELIRDGVCIAYKWFAGADVASAQMEIVFVASPLEALKQAKKAIDEALVVRRGK